jgi:hypothetical protein
MDAFTNADPLFQRAKNLGTRRLPLTRSRDPLPLVKVFLAGSVLVAIAVAFVIGVFSL